MSCSMRSFFDYILPIVPGMNKRSSEDIFRENLKKVNKKLRELYGEAYEEAYGEILINTILFYTERSAEKVWFIWQPHI